MRRIAVLNQKGGVGKTTTVVNTAAALAAMGLRVAVLDLDPQSHLTIHLGIDGEDIECSSYKVLIKSADIEEQLMLVRPNLWLLPSNIDLVGAESELVSVVGRETILREAIEKVCDKFDYLIIDCAPSLGLLTLNALAAADEILIPIQPHFLALQGFGKLLQTVELINRRINPNLKVKGILLCMFDSRASLPNEVKADIAAYLEQARGTACAWSEAEILPVHIRRNIKLAEAPSYGKTIFEYEPNCHGAEDYKKVAEFIHHGIEEVPQQGDETTITEEPIENHVSIETITDIPQPQTPPPVSETPVVRQELTVQSEVPAITEFNLPISNEEKPDSQVIPIDDISQPNSDLSASQPDKTKTNSDVS